MAVSAPLSSCKNKLTTCGRSWTPRTAVSVVHDVDQGHIAVELLSDCRVKGHIIGPTSWPDAAEWVSSCARQAWYSVICNKYDGHSHTHDRARTHKQWVPVASTTSRPHCARRS
eukprot:scaffold20_cov361-Prasinococcus_capsulatus_cf.AAC.3